MTQEVVDAIHLLAAVIGVGDVVIAIVLLLIAFPRANQE